MLLSFTNKLNNKKKLKALNGHLKLCYFEFNIRYCYQVREHIQVLTIHQQQFHTVICENVTEIQSQEKQFILNVVTL